MRFSERYGYKPPTPMLEEHDLPEELRNRIWNVLWAIHFSEDNIETCGDYSDTFKVLSWRLRHFHFKLRIDDLPPFPHDEVEVFRKRYFELPFPEFFEFLEVMASDEVELIYLQQGGEKQDRFVKECNKVLEEEKSCFRFVSNLITPITSEEEMAEVQLAADTDEGGSHIRRAIELYRDRTGPDYRNSIKESVSAVEATYRRLTGEKHRDIGGAITAMESKGMQLPKSLKAGFSNIYGWASGESGIRHALMEDDRTVTEAEARLMLVMCSAYVNYLLSLRGT